MDGVVCSSGEPLAPEYKCHKTVRAVKIKEADPINHTLLFEGRDAWKPLCVGGAYFDKHQPEAGGYYVVYADGYKSYSPARAFEEGYTLVGAVGEEQYPDVEITAGLDFGRALSFLKKGHKVARRYWDGTGLYLFLSQTECFVPRGDPDVDPKRITVKKNGDQVIFIPSVRMFTDDDTVKDRWRGYETDMLSEDWEVV